MAIAGRRLGPNRAGNGGRSWPRRHGRRRQVDAGCLRAIAGLKVAKMQALPFTADIPNKILVPRTHRNGYDRSKTVDGAKLIDIGTADRQTDAGLRGLEAWEIETAIGPKTVALLGNASGATEQDLPLLAEIAAPHHLPLIVDAAAQLPPISNLRTPLATGASLVVYSGSKALGGPQASGLLAARRDLIASAALQMLDMDVRPSAFVAPAAFFGHSQPSALPRHGIGRGFKASKGWWRWRNFSSVTTRLGTLSRRMASAKFAGVTRVMKALPVL